MWVRVQFLFRGFESIISEFSYNNNALEHFQFIIGTHVVDIPGEFVCEAEYNFLVFCIYDFRIL